MESVIFTTSGDGSWSNIAREVKVEDFVLDIIHDEDLVYGELLVYFDRETWDVDKDGLIYTDKGFLRDLRKYQTEHGLSDNVGYSEYGMQGKDFVSFDVGAEFIEKLDYMS